MQLQQLKYVSKIMVTRSNGPSMPEPAQGTKWNKNQEPLGGENDIEIKLIVSKKLRHQGRYRAQRVAR